MILRRLAKAIAEQNWFTVLLELVIVVLGIFIGLRVTEWNDDRKLRQQEAVYLELLRNDAATMRTQVEVRKARREAWAETMLAALSGLENCDQSSGSMKAVEETLESYQSGPGISIVDATYNEMVSSGSLARVADQELKRSIVTTFSDLNVLNARLGSFRVSIPVVDSIVWKRVAYSFDETGRASASFDMQAICGDAELRNAVVEMIDIQLDSVTTFRVALEQIDGLLAALDASAPASSSP